MASLTIRSLDDTVKAKLRLQAARHGWSMEQEVREILRQSVANDADNATFAQRIHQRFAAFDLDALPVPQRQSARMTTGMEE